MSCLLLVSRSLEDNYICQVHGSRNWENGIWKQSKQQWQTLNARLHCIKTFFCLQSALRHLGCHKAMEISHLVKVCQSISLTCGHVCQRHQNTTGALKLGWRAICIRLQHEIGKLQLMNLFTMPWAWTKCKDRNVCCALMAKINAVAPSAFCASMSASNSSSRLPRVWLPARAVNLWRLE